MFKTRNVTAEMFSTIVVITPAVYARHRLNLLFGKHNVEEGGDRPVSAFWDTPPAFLERIFSAIRLLENTAVRQVLTGVLRDEASSWRSSDIAYETTL